MTVSPHSRAKRRVEASCYAPAEVTPCDHAAITRHTRSEWCLWCRGEKAWTTKRRRCHVNQFRLLPPSNTVLHAGRIATRLPRECAVNSSVAACLFARTCAGATPFWFSGGGCAVRRHRTSRWCKPAVLFYLRVGTPVRVI
jgi:hypothetical protein